MAKHSETTSLTDIMEQESTGKVERPKPLPQGYYVAKIVGQPERDTNDNGTKFIQFQGEIVEAKDVDEDELEEWAQREDGTSRTLRGTPLPKFGMRFFLTADAAYRLDAFFDNLGILEKGKTRNEIAEDAVGQEFVVQLVHQEAKNEPGTFYANIKSFAPVE